MFDTGRAQFGVEINGQDMMVGADLLQFVHIIEHVHSNKPSVSLGFLDNKQAAGSWGLFQDGADVKVTIGDSKSEPLVYKFKQYGVDGIKPKAAGDLIQLSGVADVMPWFTSVVTKAQKGNASDVLKQLAQQFGIPKVDIDATQDKMTWLPDNRTVAQFARNLVDHAWMGAGKSPLKALTSEGGDWMLRVKDIMTQGSAIKTLVSNGLGDLGGAGQLKVWDHTIKSHGGALNSFANYGLKLITDDLGGSIDKFLNIDINSLSSFIGINSSLASAIGTARTIYAAASHGNCQVGSTLIPTEQGLFRLDRLAGRFDPNNLEEEHREDLNLLIGGASSVSARTQAWFYSGVRPILVVVTHLGNTLRGTSEHPNLVFDVDLGRLVWRRSIDCVPGDLLCLNPRQVLRIDPLPLSLRFPKERITRWSNPEFVHKWRSVKRPEVMTPDLAKLLGYIVAEGTTTGRGVGFGNTDREFLREYARLMREQFGIQVDMKLDRRDFSEKSIDGVKIRTFKPYYGAGVSNVALAEYMKQLGMYCGRGLRDGKKPSHFKHVPWTVLQADGASQLAFIAGHFEGDGSLSSGKGRMSWASRSHRLLSEMQIMMNAHGFFPRLRKTIRDMWSLGLNGEQAARFYVLIKPYLITKLMLNVKDDRRSRFDGVPLTHWQRLIRERYVFTQSGAGGYCAYRNDEGRLVRVNWMFAQHPQTQDMVGRKKILNYTTYDSGRAYHFLSCLRSISAEAHARLVDLLKRRYRFTPIVSITESIPTHVYDLSMNEGEVPAFTANGLIVHNTHDNYHKARHANIKSRAAFTSEVAALLHEVSGLKVLDDIQAMLANSNGTKDDAYSAMYKISGITRTIMRGSYLEKHTLTSQGVNAQN